MNATTDVLVVGAGPAGLTLAADLLRRDVQVRIIDGADTGFEGSRAKGIQPRTQEVFDDLGVLHDLLEHGTTYPLMGIHLGPLTLPWVMMRRNRVTDAVPYPNPLLAAQYDTDACLRRRVEALGGAVEYSHRLLNLCPDDGHTKATIAGPDGELAIDARYVVGADGGSSTVRRELGIAFTGDTDDSERMIIADALLDGVSRNRWHIWPRSRGRFVGICPLPAEDKFQLMIKLRSGESGPLSQDKIERIVVDSARGVRARVREVHWSTVFRPNVRLATQYRSSNAFLIGDAAHVHTPDGAQGLNTGVQDAYNLGWKLGQVLAGAPTSLLDTYEAERRPIAARVLGLSSEIHAAIGKNSLSAATRGDEERQLSLTYRGGPLAADVALDATGVQAGDRAPDATYTDADGASSTLFDAFRGPHFTLLAVGDAAIGHVTGAAWPQGGATLRRVRIPSDGASRLQQNYGLPDAAQVLVRPDGYIAYVARDAYEAAFSAAVRLYTRADGR